jgi:hypothetical protein
MLALLEVLEVDTVLLYQDHQQKRQEILRQ